MAVRDGIRWCSHGSCYEVVFSSQYSVFRESHRLTLLNPANRKLKFEVERL
jgi:hypothetical protein